MWGWGWGCQDRGSGGVARRKESSRLAGCERRGDLQSEDTQGCPRCCPPQPGGTGAAAGRRARGERSGQSEAGGAVSARGPMHGEMAQNHCQGLPVSPSGHVLSRVPPQPAQRTATRKPLPPAPPAPGAAGPTRKRVGHPPLQSPFHTPEGERSAVKTPNSGPVAGAGWRSQST